MAGQGQQIDRGRKNQAVAENESNVSKIDGMHTRLGSIFD
jgi:hypothetical protein